MNSRPPCLCTNKPGIRCDGEHCDLIRKGEAYDISQHCRVCWLYFHDEGHNRAWGGDGKVAPAPGVPGIATRQPAPIPAPSKFRQRLATPCVHLGPETGEKRDCTTCGGSKQVPLRACALHDRCTNERKLRYKDEQGSHVEVPWCVTCTDYKPRLEWISTPQLVIDAAALVGRLPPDISGVVGIPRSGMLPASIIATHMQLPLWELPNSGPPRRIGFGSRGHTLGFADSHGPLLVIDDTVYGGAAMRRARQQLQGQRVLFAAVYARPEAAEVVDLYGRLLPSPHLLEWNMMNNGPFDGHAANPIYGSGIALDFDGILCHDPDVPDADSGPGLDRYRDWLNNARPYLLPRRNPCRLIVTGRLERWRAETEEWLRRWGVRCEKLVMHPAATASERDRAGDVAQRKAEEYAKSSCGFFMESDPTQAQTIFQRSKKPVICPATNTVYS
jgi:uncharacterized HAD superfamily protein